MQKDVVPLAQLEVSQASSLARVTMQQTSPKTTSSRTSPAVTTTIASSTIAIPSGTSPAAIVPRPRSARAVASRSGSSQRRANSSAVRASSRVIAGSARSSPRVLPQPAKTGVGRCALGNRLVHVPKPPHGLCQAIVGGRMVMDCQYGVERTRRPTAASVVLTQLHLFLKVVNPRGTTKPPRGGVRDPIAIPERVSPLFSGLAHVGLRQPGFFAPEGLLFDGKCGWRREGHVEFFVMILGYLTLGRGGRCGSVRQG